MSNIPPHLPAPVCNVGDYRKWQRIKMILAATVFGLMAGVTGASIVLGWVWPGFAGGDTWILSRNVSDFTRESIEDRVRIELDDRIGSVYRELSATAGVNYLNKDKKIGEAFFISSDGWMALYYPAFDGSYKNWRVLLKNGSSFVVQKVVRDVNSNLVYLKISPINQSAQFKVVNFGDSVNINEDIFVYNNSSWHHTWVVNKISKAAIVPHLDSAPTLTYEIGNGFNAGNLAVNSQGKVVGVVTQDQYVLPSSYVVGILPSILSVQKVVYPSLGVYGWFSEEQPIIIKNESTVGFVVTRVMSGSNLKLGDVVLEINGTVVNAGNLWYNIISNQTVKLKVLRKGVVIELEQIIKQI